MKFKIILGFVLLLSIAGIVLAKQNSRPFHEGHPMHSATVYKTPTCGCCANYIGYLRTKNYEVQVVDLTQDDLTSKKHELGVPHDLDSCHTTVTKDAGKSYFVEGHIPFEAVNKLLADQPNIKGIGMPGMPSASPGMPGSKTEPFDISQVKMDGTAAPYLAL